MCFEESQSKVIDMIESDWIVLRLPYCRDIQQDLSKEGTFEPKPE